MAYVLARLRARHADVHGDEVTVADGVADLEVDVAGRRVSRGDRSIDLTRTEFQILELLMRHPGVVLDRMTIYTEIWGYDAEGNKQSATATLTGARAGANATRMTVGNFVMNGEAVDFSGTATFSFDASKGYQIVNSHSAASSDRRWVGERLEGADDQLVLPACPDAAGNWLNSGMARCQTPAVFLKSQP